MAASVLMAGSAGLLLVFGLVHLLYTFSGAKLRPRDRALAARMEEVSPVISKETTMWRCWVGINATHSMALILFGLVYGYLALAQRALLFGSPYLLVVGLLAVAALVALARAYFFRVPFVAGVVALACYLASVAVAIA